MHLFQLFIRRHFTLPYLTNPFQHFGTLETGTEISKATINTMAEGTTVSELEEDQDLLIEALRRHLTYVEVNASLAQSAHGVIILPIG